MKLSYRQFRTFLQECDCEEAFDEAFYRHNDYISLDEALWEAGDATYIFGYTFDWSDTPEGREYWLDIDKLWTQFIKSI